MTLHLPRARAPPPLSTSSADSTALFQPNSRIRNTELTMPITKSTREKLAVRIKKELQLSRKALAKAVEHAVEAGKLLIEAKKGLDHGKWSEWLTENVSVTDRQAQKYMRLAKNRAKLNKANPNWSSDLTIAEALQFISEWTREPNGNGASTKDDAYDAKVDEEQHKVRLTELQRFDGGRRLAKADKPIKQAVVKDIDDFIREFVELAMKHARSLRKNELKEVRAEPDLVAMVLARQLLESLDVEKHFAPKFKRKAA